MKKITLQQAAEMLGVSPQAVCQAVRRGTLGAKLIGRRYYTTEQSVAYYAKNKRFANEIIVNGSKIYSEKAGTYSVKQVAHILKISIYKVYNLIYIGVIKSKRKGKYHVIHKDEISKLQRWDYEEIA